MNQHSWRNNVYFLVGRELAEKYINSRRNHDRYNAIFQITRGYDRTERCTNTPNLSSLQIINYVFGFVSGYTLKFGSTFMDPIKGDLITFLFESMRLGTYQHSVDIFNRGIQLSKKVFESKKPEEQKEYLFEFAIGSKCNSYKDVATLALGFLEYLKRKNYLNTEEIEKTSDYISQSFE